MHFFLNIHKDIYKENSYAESGLVKKYFINVTYIYKSMKYRIKNRWSLIYDHIKIKYLKSVNSVVHLVWG